MWHVDACGVPCNESRMRTPGLSTRVELVLSMSVMDQAVSKLLALRQIHMDSIGLPRTFMGCRGTCSEEEVDISTLHGAI